ncbi:MAG: SAM-dependent chlorinase/fluorinase [Bacteroidales bacterium]|nr:SAM-dependent chlorinase/fluorinase [Bacteroidales bacterium]
MQSLVSIISDWKNHDYYLPLLKGALLAISDRIRILDISHNIPTFDYQRAGFVLKSAHKLLPEGSIHLIAVNTEANSEYPYAIVKHKNHYFIGVDNGIFGIIFDSKPDLVIHCDEPEIYFPSFPCLSVYPNLVNFILNDGDISELGDEMEDVFRKTEIQPIVELGSITGNILYIDSYNNGITNINRKIFEKHVGDKSFDIYINSTYNHVKKICKTYDEAPIGELLVLFNSLDLLEIAVRNDDAASLLNLDKKSYIKINF